jgi:hypothetical protein
MFPIAPALRRAARKSDHRPPLTEAGQIRLMTQTDLSDLMCTIVQADQKEGVTEPPLLAAKADVVGV